MNQPDQESGVRDRKGRTGRISDHDEYARAQRIPGRPANSQKSKEEGAQARGGLNRAVLGPGDPGTTNTAMGKREEDAGEPRTAAENPRGFGCRGDLGRSYGAGG